MHAHTHSTHTHIHTCMHTYTYTYKSICYYRISQLEWCEVDTATGTLKRRVSMSSTNLGSSWFVTWRAEEYNYINGQTGKTGKQIHCNWRMSSSLRSRFPCSDPTTGKYNHEKHRRETSLTLSRQLEQPRITLSKNGHLEAAISECNRLAGLTETRIPAVMRWQSTVLQFCSLVDSSTSMMLHSLYTTH